MEFQMDTIVLVKRKKNLLELEKQINLVLTQECCENIKLDFLLANLAKIKNDLLNEPNLIYPVLPSLD
jgi:hypothetical protein